MQRLLQVSIEKQPTRQLPKSGLVLLLGFGSQIVAHLELPAQCLHVGHLTALTLQLQLTRRQRLPRAAPRRPRLLQRRWLRTACDRKPGVSKRGA